MSNNYGCDGCGADVPAGTPCRCLAIQLDADEMTRFLRWQNGEIRKLRTERDAALVLAAALREELRDERLYHGATRNLLGQARAFGRLAQDFHNDWLGRVRNRAAAWKQSAKLWRERAVAKAETPPPVGAAGGESEEDRARKLGAEDGSAGHPRKTWAEVFSAIGSDYNPPLCQVYGAAYDEASAARSDASQLPAWRRELERMRELVAKAGEESFLSDEIRRRLAALESLDKLRGVVESGEGEAEVPESVAKHLKVPSGKYQWMRYYGYSTQPLLRVSSLVHKVQSEVLSAIDAAGAEIVGGKQ